jgi:hypothetical protein
MDVEEMECEGFEWNYMAQNTIQWLASANPVTILQVLLQYAKTLPFFLQFTYGFV